MGMRVEKLPLVVSSVGLDEREERLLKLAIEMTQDRGAPCRYAGSDNTLGHLVVVDVDSPEGEAVLPRLTPDQLKLLFTSERIEGERIVSLVKPVKLEVVRAVLTKAALEFQRQQRRVEKAG